MNRSSLFPAQQHLFPSLRTVSALGETWELVAEYDPDRAGAEYQALRSSDGAGVIDRSWQSVLRLSGPDRHTFLQGMVTNDILGLGPGQSCRAAFLDATGHILAFLRVHETGDALLLETDPRVLPRLAQTLDMYLIMEDVQIADVSGEWSILALRGGGAEGAVRALTDLPTRHFTASAFGDGPGLDLWLPVTAAATAWESLVEQGVTTAGELAAELLRVESGEPAWGHELSEAVLLPEADLADVVSYTKGCYIGQEIIARLHARGHANRLLRGILLGADAPVPHPGDTVHAPEDTDEAGREIGRITSAVASPLFDGRSLVLAYVRREYAEPTTSVAVHITQPGGAVFAFAGQILTRPFTPIP